MESSASVSELVSVLHETLPMENVSLAFAYGSGVFQQAQAANLRKNMTDFIFAVNDTKAFHTANVLRNPQHYSFVKYFGSDRLSKLQRNYGAKMYFNTLVRTKCGRLIKYGVIDVDDLQEDLLDWDKLYVAGRLHKPVLFLKHHRPLDTALVMNLKCAVHCALLLLPQTFSWHDFFIKITSLSYHGDFRTIIGEDINKISNIVTGNTHRFKLLYEPLLADMQQVHITEGNVEQDRSPAAVHHHLQLLPRNILWRMHSIWTGKGKLRDLEEATFTIAQHREYSALLNESLMSTVRSSSVSQSAKNALTAGARKSVTYSWTKVLKMVRSMARK